MPEKPIRDIRIETVFGGDYGKVRVETDAEEPVLYTVRDADGREVARTEDSVINIENPRLWDTEHPHLYTLRATTSKPSRASFACAGTERAYLPGNVSPSPRLSG